MKVCIYVEFESKVGKSGIGVSAKQQRKALSDIGVDVVDNPMDADVLDINTVGPKSFYYMKKAKKKNKTVIVHAHTTSEDFRESFIGSNYVSPLIRVYLKNFYNRADGVIVPSQYTKRILKNYDISSSICVVSNGVDFKKLEGYKELRNKYRERYDLDNLVVFSVGHVFERKGLTTFCRLAKEFPEMDFVWFGPINRFASLKTRKWIKNPPDNVSFTGYIEDIRGGFGAGDIFLFPTKEENQGIAVLEAMACKKGIIVSDLPVFEEFLDHQKNCLKASIFDEYKQSLKEMKNDKKRKEFGKKANEEAKKHSLTKIGKKLLEIYQDISNGKSKTISK